jgi:hypothetical protein
MTAAAIEAPQSDRELELGTDRGDTQNVTPKP